MVQNAAKTVKDYLDELPEDRRYVVSALRDVILANLPDGYVETISAGMIAYVIPLERYPITYNKQPLFYAALAAQKNHFAFYLMSIYGDPKRETALREGFARNGKKLDMGKSCIRFKKLDEVPLDVIGEIVASTTPDAYIAFYEKVKGIK